MTPPMTPREKVTEQDDLLFYKLKDLIIEQSEGEWADAMIVKDAHHFANHLRPLFERTALASGSSDHAELARMVDDPAMDFGGFGRSRVSALLA